MYLLKSGIGMAGDNDEIQIKDAASDQLYPALFQCFAIILCGYIAGRLNVVSQSESKGLATYVGTFALPSLIFLSLAQVDFSSVNWTFLLAILLAKGVVFFAVIIVTVLVLGPMHLGQAGLYAIFCTQSNDFAIGYPILNAIYAKTHPEYALYLYLMAPISLAVLNPFAFVLMEIHKQKQSTQSIDAEGRRGVKKLFLQIFKGIVFNPILVMTLLGILGNIIFKHHLSIYIEGLLDLFGKSFSASALFLLGLRMVGQIHRLRGRALFVPCVLIMVKLVVLPLAMRAGASALRAGGAAPATASLASFAFLYGTVPTAPAVFVFSNLYDLEIDLVASAMVVCTCLSAPIMFLSAQVLYLTGDYDDQIGQFAFDLSIAALCAAAWVAFVFVFTNKYQRMPHRITFCLAATQLLMAASVVWGGPRPGDATSPSWRAALQQACLTFATLSCLLWTSMLSVGLVVLERRGARAAAALWPALALAACGAPAAAAALCAAAPQPAAAGDVVRLCLLCFCLAVTGGCLISYVRSRRRAAPGEAARLLGGAAPGEAAPGYGDYGAVDGAAPATPPALPAPAADRAGEPRAELRGERRGEQRFKHTVLIIAYSLMMFIDLAYSSWRVLGRDAAGASVEVRFVRAAAVRGQALLPLVLFGLEPRDVVVPVYAYLRNKWGGGDAAPRAAPGAAPGAGCDAQ